MGPPVAAIARDFVHPEDEAALRELRAIPLFTEALQAVMKLLPERLLHGINMAQKVRLSRTQLPEIYRHLPEICATLAIEEPELYLEMNPVPNAYTYGDKATFVTVTSGLVEGLEEHEVRSVLAHECGHIALQHPLYHTMAALLTIAGASILGPLAPAAQPVIMALRYWMRRSELSADRAAAAVDGSVGGVVTTLVRLAGGPKSITERIDIGEYAEQAAAYDRLSESKWDQLLQGVAVSRQTHPFLAVRTREILAWGETEEFTRVVSRLHGGRDGVTSKESAAAEGECGSCRRPVESGWRYCRWCGARLEAPAASGMS